jgi:hypothetical protein
MGFNSGLKGLNTRANKENGNEKLCEIIVN